MEIKLLIFDLDGVLVKTNNIHLDALNKSLATIDTSLQITEEEDIKYFGTVPTKEKLKILTELKGLSPEHYDTILSLKKEFSKITLETASLDSFFSEKTKECIDQLSQTYLLYVASNTHRDFIIKTLTRANILQYFSKIFSNEDVTQNKPHPEIYLKCFIESNLSPQECVIFEDSTTGQEAAIRSGAHVYPIENTNDINYEDITHKLSKIKNKPIKWKSSKINVLIPMAGEGSRFKQAGYQTPKPIIDVNGLPMVGLVADKLNIDAHFIFIVKGEHCEQYNLETLLNLMQPNCTIVKTWGQQCGAACSVLEAKPFIDNENHLLIVNSDQIWDWDANAFYYQMIREDLDGGIVTFEDKEKNPKWSFAKINNSGYVTEVAEKNPISELGTAGIYYYKYGSDFVKYAEQMISKNIRVNNEFYVAPIYNEFILDDKKIKTFNCDRMIGLGTPEDLEIYLKESKCE